MFCMWDNQATRMTLQWCVALSMVLMQLSDTAGLIYFVLELAIRSRTVLTKLRKEMKKFIGVFTLHGLQEASDGNTVNFMRGFWISPSQDIFSELRLVQVQSIWIQLIFFIVSSIVLPCVTDGLEQPTWFQKCASVPPNLPESEHCRFLFAEDNGGNFSQSKEGEIDDGRWERKGVQLKRMESGAGVGKGDEMH